MAITRSIIKIHAHVIWEQGGKIRGVKGMAITDNEGWNAQLISRKAKEDPHKK